MYKYCLAALLKSITYFGFLSNLYNDSSFMEPLIYGRHIHPNVGASPGVSGSSSVKVVICKTSPGYFSQCDSAGYWTQILSTSRALTPTMLTNGFQILGLPKPISGQSHQLLAVPSLCYQPDASFESRACLAMRNLCCHSTCLHIAITWEVSQEGWCQGPSP